MCRPRTARGAGAGRTASTASNNSKQQQQQPPGEARGRGGNEMPRVPVERWFHGDLRIDSAALRDSLERGEVLDAGEAVLRRRGGSSRRCSRIPGSAEDRRDRLVAVACEFASFLEFVSTLPPTLVVVWRYQMRRRRRPQGEGTSRPRRCSCV